MLHYNCVMLAVNPVIKQNNIRDDIKGNNAKLHDSFIDAIIKGPEDFSHLQEGK